MGTDRRQRAFRRPARARATPARRPDARRKLRAGTAAKHGGCSLLTSKRTVFVVPSTHGVWSVIRFLRQSLELSPLGGSLMPQNQLRGPLHCRISAAVSATFARVSSWGWTPAAGRCYLLSSSPRRRRQHVRRVVWRLVSGKRRVWRSVSLGRRHERREAGPRKQSIPRTPAGRQHTTKSAVAASSADEVRCRGFEGNCWREGRVTGRVALLQRGQSEFEQFSRCASPPGGTCSRASAGRGKSDRKRVGAALAGAARAERVVPAWEARSISRSGSEVVLPLRGAPVASRRRPAITVGTCLTQETSLPSRRLDRTRPPEGASPGSAKGLWRTESVVPGS
jgi:hypothetical protein